ncbi:L-type lectin-domain containing receptor kinase IV.1-like [Prosopis cineraria]|uniref:L-type lectin-domain containing receptor kinase IV.1-like n=1 Tax=Prosopis cineraria TaxID=364024 RepID=UPI00240ED7EA|nr:L-type lectin-domain containing receptor kinase IV.1-like [Prosopis cineraria]
MFVKIMALAFLLVTAIVPVRGEDTSFTFNNGFLSANLTMDGLCSITSNGLLQLTNETRLQKCHAFYPNPIGFSNTSSFSTTFVFAIRPQYPTLSGHGLALVVSPAKAFPGALGSQYLGLFNGTNNGNPKNHVLAVEFDPVQNNELGDINDNHVGIDINGLNSTKSAPVGYYVNGLEFHNLSLISGLPMQVWVDYDGANKQINVTLAPINLNKPQTPLLMLSQDLSHILKNPSYVGFSSSTGSLVASHYVLGWSFKVNGEAQNLVTSELPKLPRLGGKKQSMILLIGLPLFFLCLIILASLSIVYYINKRRKFSEIVEKWEEDYGGHRFKYKDLYLATKEFGETELLGSGGFGKVYKGTMPGSTMEVAVKKVSHESRQGMKEFIAEIVSIGRVRHRNLVSLLGYCRRKGELLLVYDFMPNGSLDKYLFNQPKETLNWMQRFTIIKGIASGLCYLHEEWEQVVVHRDIKASNVLLDSEHNGRLGDFGLARLYDHGSDPATTHVVGTFGYLAPENTRTGKATTKTDVFAFGAFLLEVACGRRPIEQGSDGESVILVDWVHGLWKRGEIIEAIDQNLGRDYRAEEVELVLKLGLLCSNSQPLSRPSMRQVMQYLNRDVPLPDLSLIISTPSCFEFKFGIHKDFDDIGMSFPSSSTGGCFSRSSMPESVLSGGR